VEEHIKEMLEAGVIRPSTSPYRSPVTIQKKKNGGIRFCIDLRRLNSITVKNSYPLPRIDDTLGAPSISIDGGGHYECNRMPMGATGAPVVFQNLMDNIFEGELRKFVLIYLDDINIYSTSWQEHLRHLKIVSQRLEGAGLKALKKKLFVAHTRVNFFGHTVSQEGVKPDEDKIRAVKDYPRPRNVDQVRAFVGFANYYRRFVAGFAEKAHELTQLTKKGVTWEWGEKQEGAFQCLKKSLISAPLLRYPDFSKPFTIFTDASGHGAAGILSQTQTIVTKNERGEKTTEEAEVVIAYTSKHLTETQAKWSATEKEAFAIVHAVKTFYHYICGTTFTIVTDHRPLEFMMSK